MDIKPDTHKEIKDVNVPLAYVKGQPFLTIPKDLYLPPDALEVVLDSFEGPLPPNIPRATSIPVPTPNPDDIPPKTFPIKEEPLLFFVTLGGGGFLLLLILLFLIYNFRN